MFLALGHMKPRQDRIFHYITAAITMVASIAYFSMASNLGFTPIAVEFRRSNPVVSGVYREIFYVRYIDWMVTTPLLLMDLLLTAGMPWPTLIWVILVDWVMIVTGLVGALVVSSYKWGYFAFGKCLLASYATMIGVQLLTRVQAAPLLPTSSICSPSRHATMPTTSAQMLAVFSSCAVL